jgi:hypothetical protein
MTRKALQEKIQIVIGQKIDFDGARIVCVAKDVDTVAVYPPIVGVAGYHCEKELQRFQMRGTERKVVFAPEQDTLFVDEVTYKELARRRRTGIYNDRR